jgi:hypothetical protein
MRLREGEELGSNVLHLQPINRLVLMRFQRPQSALV